MTLPLLERSALRERVASLLNSQETSGPRPEWVRVIGDIVKAFGYSVLTTEPFIRSWQELYTLTILLDHVQDGDELAPTWFAQLPQALQYHLIFSTYALAQDSVHGPYPDIPEHRVARLLHLWSRSVTHLAEGQYRDLTETATDDIEGSQSLLDSYEAIIRLKTGVLFALGFGGAAVLTTDDEDCINAALGAGEIFGMLLQYGDDLLDAEAQSQQRSTITLQRALQRSLPEGSEEGTAQLTWAFVYATYVRSLATILAPLPASVRDAIQLLVQETFGPPPAPIAEAVTRIDVSHDEPQTI